MSSESDILSGDISIDIESGTIALGQNGSNTLELEGAIDISEERRVFFALPPITFTENIDVTIVSTKGQGTCSINMKGQSIESGKILSKSLDNIEWLIATNYYGRANSIIVPPSSSTATIDCTPYYTTSLSYAYENILASDSRLAHSAKLLWNDVSTDFVSDVTLNADQKSFTVSLNGQSGNAIIAIYDKENPDDKDATILWSFHIWVTEIKEQILEINSKGNSYSLLDRNLGAVSNVPGDWQSIGLLYQWGRKDPFVSTSENGKNSNVIMYNKEGTVSLSTVNGGSTSGTVEYAIKNPSKFIKYSRSKSNTSTHPYYYAYDWLYHANDALWGNPEGYSYPVAGTINKSIYDPCPEGYMVAPRDTWLKADNGTNKEASVLSEAIWDTANKGYSLTRTNEQQWWYPIGGWRGRRDGKLSAADTNGYYWYSTVEKEKSANAAFMNINKDGITLNGKNCRANSCSVRCVKVNN